MGERFKDSWLIVGLAISIYVGALAIHKQLTRVRQDAQITKEEGFSQDKINHRTQNAIKLATLGHLLDSASPEIRWASVKIITERNIQSPAVWKILRRDLAGKNAEMRDNALSMLSFLTSYFEPSLRDDLHFNHPDTHRAMVKCLCNMLPRAREAEIKSQHHSPVETQALWVLQQLIKINPEGIQLALQAGLVTKWLVRYPLEVNRPRKRKVEIIRELISKFEYDDDYERFFCLLLYQITQTDGARQQMKKCGIGDPGAVELARSFNGNARVLEGRNAVVSTLSDLQESDAIDADDDDFLVVEENAMQNLNDDGNINERIRRREESLEERSLRRRRREAMVYAENGRPVQSEDIIQRENTIREDEDVGVSLHPEEEGDEQPPESDQAEGWWSWMTRIRPDGLAPLQA